MRAIVRAFIAIALIGSLLVVKRHLDSLRSQWQESSGWDFILKHDGLSVEPASSDNDPAPPAPVPVPASEEPASEEPATEDASTPTQLDPTAPSHSDRIIVVGKTREEDTSWVTDELTDWQNAIYAVDDPDAPLRVAKNKGKESSVYLQYLIDHYDDLPSTIVFLHAHRDGAWHIEFEGEHDNVLNVQRLQIEHVQRMGYVNLRCTWSPGCPKEVQPFREDHDFRFAEAAFPDAWRALFDDTPVPEVVAIPCCSQFAVSRNQVHRRPRGDYVRYYDWLMGTNLDDEVSGRILEYLWHVIFGQDPVYCPDFEECMHDVYGQPYWEELFGPGDIFN